MPYDLDIKAGICSDGRVPQEGWHRVEADRLAYVTLRGNAYQMQAFAPGEVTNHNFEALAERSRRIAWNSFAEMGIPGPSRPDALKPPEQAQIGR